MTKTTWLRIGNGAFWLWMWFSAVMLPVTISTEDFWGAKAAQLFSLNPNISDVPTFVGNGVFPFLFWFVVDRIMKRKPKSTGNEQENGGPSNGG